MPDGAEIEQPARGLQDARLKEELMNGTEQHTPLRRARMQPLNGRGIGRERLLDEDV